ncbi:MAG: hypothetical protein IPG66_05835 [Hydrogenophilales bacterium]|nr:hypothetical protein [Hydrogenophilales bacterium]
MGLMDKILEWVSLPPLVREDAPNPLPPGKEGATFREAYGVTVDDDDDQWRRLTGDSSRDLSPMSQQRMREIALYLWETNLLGNRIVELPVAYLLAEGVRLACDDEASQDLLDRFWRDPINQMDIKLPKKVRELAIYGEQCYPVFINERSGAVRLGYLDPGLIETVVVDPDNPEQAVGIVTVKDKKGQARRYKVIVNGPDEELFTQRTQAIRETFTDGEAFWFTVNDLSNGRRGRSDLLAQADWLDGYDGYLFGELDRAQFMRAFIWDVTLTGATPDEVMARAKNIVAPRPGSVRVHNEAEAWKPETPDLKAQDGAEGARLFRNHVLGGATIPEHWFGGGGDVNRAVGAEMGEPTFKMFSMRQKIVKYMLEQIGVYVLRRAAMAKDGKEPDIHDEALQVEAIFPELTAKDTSKYAAALQQVVVACALAMEKGLITKTLALQIIGAISGRLGVEIDAEDELKKAVAEASTAADDDVFTTNEGDE